MVKCRKCKLYHSELLKADLGLCKRCKAVRAANRKADYKRRYGITVDDYDRLFKQQKGLCMICKSPETRLVDGKLTKLSVDHCHETKIIRGLLCNKCNRAIGLLFDCPKLVKSALNYLKKSRVK